MSTLVLISKICNNTLKPVLTKVASALDLALCDSDIDTDFRLAMFLSQLAHESGEFRYIEELASGAAYEGRKDLGNVVAGDGVRYKGRGWIQLTGRRNYKEAGHALGLQLEGSPELAAQPVVSARVAVWFWRTHNLNRYADAQDVEGCTKRINGGLNGIESRKLLYKRAIEALKESPCDIKM